VRASSAASFAVLPKHDDQKVIEGADALVSAIQGMDASLPQPSAALSSTEATASGSLSLASRRELCGEQRLGKRAPFRHLVKLRFMGFLERHCGSTNALERG
jgi:hypothetical protein